MTVAKNKPPRLAVRGVVLHQKRLLLVNAWPGNQSDLWCTPGGGVETGCSLPDNLRREIWEECGLEVEVGAPCLVNEFHDPGREFHQIEVFFRCTLLSPEIPERWNDPEGIVDRRRWIGRDEIGGIRLKPSRLPAIAWGDGFDYDPLEPIVR